MSDGEPGERPSVATLRRTVERGRAGLFGDAGGLVVFLTAVVVLWGLWRVDFLLNDSATVGNVLVNVADGHLAVTESPYALTAGEQPGLVAVDGQFYGRNYGQIYLAVPFLWSLDAVAGLVDLRLLLAAGWSLALLALARAVARLRDRPVLADAGAVIAVGAFAASALVATDMGWLQRPRPLVALGLSTMLLAATGATALYRLLSWIHGRRVGMAGGLGLVLATPVGFWGSFPKRHVLSATVLVLVVALFAASRTGTDRRAVLARAGAYAVVGLFASVHAFEAVFTFAVLVPLDVLTAPTNDRRTLAVVLVVFAVSLVPMLVTNTAISGNPMKPPRKLVGVDGGLSLDPAEAPIGDAGAGSAGGESSGTGGGTDGGPTPGDGSGQSGDGIPFVWVLAPLAPVVDRFFWILEIMFRSIESGLAAATELDRLYHVMVRSGWVPDVRYHLTAYETLELSFLEAFPLSGALLALPSLLVAGVSRRAGSLRDHLRSGLADPVRQTDLFAASLGLTLFVVYLPELPLFAMITQRYVVLVMPLVLYGVCRLAPVRAALTDHGRLVGGAYAGTLLVGGLALGVTFATLDLARGEAVQLHALLGLGAGVVVALAAVGWPLHRRDRAVAVGLALAAGTTTLFVVASGLVVFTDGNHALDLVRVVAGLLPTVG